MIKEFYTDGACSGNPGPGGYAVCSLDNNNLAYSYVEYSENTTNNREELKAILHVIKLAYNDKENTYVVYSDSAYAINSITDWIYSWSRNGWINSKKKPIENIDLMQEIYKYIKFPLSNFELKKIKGHCGLLGNEIVDALASKNKQKYINLIHKYNIIDF